MEAGNFRLHQDSPSSFISSDNEEVEPYSEKLQEGLRFLSPCDSSFNNESIKQDEKITTENKPMLNLKTLFKNIPENNDLSDSFMSKMSNLKLSSQDKNFNLEKNKEFENSVINDIGNDMTGAGNDTNDIQNHNIDLKKYEIDTNNYYITDNTIDDSKNSTNTDFTENNNNDTTDIEINNTGDVITNNELIENMPQSINSATTLKQNLFKNVQQNTSGLSNSFLSKMSNLNLSNGNMRNNADIMTAVEINNTDNSVSISQMKNILESQTSMTDLESQMTDREEVMTVVNYNNDKSNSLVSTTEHPLKVEEKREHLTNKLMSELTDKNCDNISIDTPPRNVTRNMINIDNLNTPICHVIKTPIISVNDSEITEMTDVKDSDGLKRVHKNAFNAFFLKNNSSTPQHRVVPCDANTSAIDNVNTCEEKKCVSEKESTLEREEFYSGVSEMCEVSSNYISTSNYELPNDISNTAPCKSMQSTEYNGDKNLKYQAIIDPYSGNVLLKHTNYKQRRKIVAAPDTWNSDSDSVSSLDENIKSDVDKIGLANLEIGSKEDNVLQLDRSNPLKEIPEYTREEERYEERAWMKVTLSCGLQSTVDMLIISPHKSVLTHGGYSPTGAAILVLSASRLPDTSNQNYNYIMSHLFVYIMWTLERLVTDTYELVYVHGAASRGRLPSWHWLQECYKLIDRRIRKSLKRLYLVHPTFWLKSLVFMSKPFVSSKFHSKLTYVKNLKELTKVTPVQLDAIGDVEREYDATL